MEVQIYCCSVVDYVATGEWVLIESALENVDVSFIGVNGEKKTVEMAHGEKITLPFVGLQLRSKGDDQVISIRTGWGDLTPSKVSIDTVGMMDDPVLEPMPTCVDIASPVEIKPSQIEKHFFSEVRIPAGGDVNLGELNGLRFNGKRISKIKFQNTSETVTKIRLNTSDFYKFRTVGGYMGGYLLMGGGDSVAESDWFEVAGSSVGWAAHNQSSEDATLVICGTLYFDIPNACQMNEVD